MKPIVGREDAGAYVLGVLPRDEREAFERLLWRDPSVARLVDECRHVTAQLAYAAPPASPPPGLRAKVMATLG